MAAAIERSLSPQGTTALNIGDTVPLPVGADTANVRLGPPLDDANLSLLPLVGVWRGEGHLHGPQETPDRVFGQQLTISHDGRGFLRHESITWVFDEDGTALPAGREVGWWRPQPDGVIELVLADADGVVEVFYGTAQTLASWSLGTDAVLRTTSAPAVTGATRLYGIVDGRLAYVSERATAEHPMRPYASALLDRQAG
ncbi:FABP family protein [Nakamurella deserti]|uniref:FABP family protein n=1 Tax=Nakamurella deserti TaxID=2164074 RepID=UPI003B83391F